MCSTGGKGIACIYAEKDVLVTIMECNTMESPISHILKKPYTLLKNDLRHEQIQLQKLIHWDV